MLITRGVSQYIFKCSSFFSNVFFQGSFLVWAGRMAERTLGEAQPGPTLTLLQGVEVLARVEAVLVPMVEGAGLPQLQSLKGSASSAIK